MKEKLQPEKASYNFKLKTSTSNLLINIIIFILGILIIFLGYSLFQKIQSGRNTEIQKINSRKTSPTIQVEVLNGCGIPGAADNFTSFLRKNNFDVVQIGNYISFDVEKSMVIDRVGNTANAIKIADALGIDRKNIIQQINKNYFLDASVVIGKDFDSLKPNQ
ncbi:MAG: LytR C-terminal domain-containing protein [Ignavibacteriaceae bacterium]